MANPENTPIEHTVEELIRLRAENRSLAADLYMAKKEAHDWKEYAESTQRSLERFGRHKVNCEKKTSASDGSALPEYLIRDNAPCTCGLDEATTKPKPESPK